MSHDITIRNDGFAEAAFSLTPAWHGLGKTFDHVMTSREAFTEAGLDWTVEQDNILSQSNQTKIDGFRVNYRSDTGLVLGVVTDTYKVVQNAEAFEFIDALVDEGEMRYESAFSLNGGKKVVLLAQLPRILTVAKNDTILPYILLSLSHDGTEAIRFGAVATRVVCANTYAVANEERGVQDMTIRHKGNIKDKLAKARKILQMAHEDFDKYAAISQQLADAKLTQSQWDEYLNIMCPLLDPRDPDYTPRRQKRLEETRGMITNRFHNERQTLEGIVNSCWAAFNAVTEHIDHMPRRGATRERKAECRFNTTIYGVGRDMKERAFQTACRFAGLAG